MRQRVKAVTRVAAAALVAGALVVGPVLASPASADLQSFQSRGEAYALGIIIDLSGLPQVAKDALNTAWAGVPESAKVAAGLPVSQFPFVLDQQFVRTTSDATDSMTKALSVLGAVGETPNAWGKDLGSVSADAIGQTNGTSAHKVQLPTADLPLIQGTLGALTASVGSGPKVDGNASIASVIASLDLLGDQVPELRQAMDLVFDALDTATTTANQTIDDAADTLFTTIGPAVVGTPVADVIGSAEDLVEQVDVPTVPNPFGNGVSLASIQNVVSNTTAIKLDGKSMADATTTIQSVDVLDGFLKAGIINLSAHSEAAGVAGSAANSASCSIADLRVGGNNGVSLDGKNLYVELGGQPVALPVPADQVASLKSQVDSVLAEAGVSVELCDSSQATAAADGLSATQKVSAFIVTIEPKIPAGVDLSGTPLAGLGVGDSLGVRIIVDPTVRTAVGGTPATVGPPSIAPAPAQLPRTGAPALATIMSGAMLAAGAIALRRRVR